MKIFITGSDGFIGSHLVEKLIEKGHKVKALVQYNSFGSIGHLEYLDKNYKGNFINYMFDPFLIFQRRKNIKGFGPNLLGLLDNTSKKINHIHRKDKNLQNNFISIFKAKNKVNRALRLLNQTNILGKFVPAFGKVVAQMQHDLFHIYTVDEHTLNVIENLRR